MSHETLRLRDRKALKEAADDLLRKSGVCPSIPSRKKAPPRPGHHHRQRQAFSRSFLRAVHHWNGANDKGVYVVGAPGFPVKIGIAKDVERRLPAIQTGCPAPLKVYLFQDGLPSGAARQIEKMAHRILHDRRMAGEWFDVDWREARALVQKLAARYWPINDNAESYQAPPQARALRRHTPTPTLVRKSG
jgi:hypothetical protein